MCSLDIQKSSLSSVDPINSTHKVRQRWRWVAYPKSESSMSANSPRNTFFSMPGIFTHLKRNFIFQTFISGVVILVFGGVLYMKSPPRTGDHKLFLKQVRTLWLCSFGSMVGASTKSWMVPSLKISDKSQFFWVVNDTLPSN